MEATPRIGDCLDFARVGKQLAADRMVDEQQIDRRGWRCV
jgi:hypothetical protein